MGSLQREDETGVDPSLHDFRRASRDRRLSARSGGSGRPRPMSLCPELAEGGAADQVRLQMNRK